MNSISIPRVKKELPVTVVSLCVKWMLLDSFGVDIADFVRLLLSERTEKSTKEE